MEETSSESITTRSLVWRQQNRDFGLMMGVRIGGRAILFLATIFMAHVLGETQFGLYALAMSWVAILTVLGVHGQDRLVLREMSIRGISEGDLAARQLMIAARRRVLSVTIACAIGLLFAGAWLPHPGSSDVSSPWIPASILILLTSLLVLYRGGLSGVNRPLFARTIEEFCYPVGILIGIGGVAALVPEADASDMLWWMVITASVCVGVCIWAIHRKDNDNGTPSTGAPAKPSWTAVATFSIISGAAVLNTRIDTIMLGFYESEATVGIYSVAARIAETTTLVTVSVNAVFAPRIGNAISEGKSKQVQTLAAHAATISFSATVALGVALALLGAPILSLFGPPYMQGSTALSILLIGLVLRSAVGAAVPLLLALRMEKRVAVLASMSMLLNVLTNLWLIPILGIEGAAIATAMTYTGTAACWITLLLVGSRIVSLPFARLRSDTIA